MSWQLATALKCWLNTEKLGALIKGTWAPATVGLRQGLLLVTANATKEPEIRLDGTGGGYARMLWNPWDAAWQQPTWTPTGAYLGVEAVNYTFIAAGPPEAELSDMTILATWPITQDGQLFEIPNDGPIVPGRFNGCSPSHFASANDATFLSRLMRWAAMEETLPPWLYRLVGTGGSQDGDGKWYYGPEYVAGEGGYARKRIARVGLQVATLPGNAIQIVIPWTLMTIDPSDGPWVIAPRDEGYAPTWLGLSTAQDPSAEQPEDRVLNGRAFVSVATRIEVSSEPSRCLVGRGPSGNDQLKHQASATIGPIVRDDRHAGAGYHRVVERLDTRGALWEMGWTVPSAGTSGYNRRADIFRFTFTRTDPDQGSSKGGINHIVGTHDLLCLDDPCNPNARLWGKFWRAGDYTCMIGMSLGYLGWTYEVQDVSLPLVSREAVFTIYAATFQNPLPPSTYGVNAASFWRFHSAKSGLSFIDPRAERLGDLLPFLAWSYGCNFTHKGKGQASAHDEPYSIETVIGEITDARFLHAGWPVHVPYPSNPGYEHKAVRLQFAQTHDHVGEELELNAIAEKLHGAALAMSTAEAQSPVLDRLGSGLNKWVAMTYANNRGLFYRRLHVRYSYGGHLNNVYRHGFVQYACDVTGQLHRQVMVSRRLFGSNLEPDAASLVERMCPAAPGGAPSGTYLVRFGQDCDASQNPLILYGGGNSRVGIWNYKGLWPPTWMQADEGVPSVYEDERGIAFPSMELTAGHQGHIVVDVPYDDGLSVIYGRVLDAHALTTTPFAALDVTAPLKIRLFAAGPGGELTDTPLLNGVAELMQQVYLYCGGDRKHRGFLVGNFPDDGSGYEYKLFRGAYDPDGDDWGGPMFGEVWMQGIDADDDTPPTNWTCRYLNTARSLVECVMLGTEHELRLTLARLPGGQYREFNVMSPGCHGARVRLEFAKPPMTLSADPSSYEVPYNQSIDMTLPAAVAVGVPEAVSETAEDYDIEFSTNDARVWLETITMPHGQHSVGAILRMVGKFTSSVTATIAVKLVRGRGGTTTGTYTSEPIQITITPVAA